MLKLILKAFCNLNKYETHKREEGHKVTCLIICTVRDLRFHVASPATLLPTCFLSGDKRAFMQKLHNLEQLYYLGFYTLTLSIISDCFDTPLSSINNLSVTEVKLLVRNVGL